MLRYSLLRTFVSRFVLALIGFGCFQLEISAQTGPIADWTQFRGTDGTGTAPSSARPPVNIDLATQTVWELDIPGTGWSSPVYENGKIWLTTAITRKATQAEIDKKLAGDRLASIKTFAASVDIRAICIDLESGKLLHNIKLSQINEPKPISPMNSYASPTPAIRNGKVVCHFGNYGTWCLDAETGKKLWEKTLVVDHSVGPGSSPVIFGDQVVIVCDGMDKQYVTGLNLDTGVEVWKTDRPSIKAADPEYRKAYCTPILINANDQPQMVIPGAQWVIAYEPKTGRELWRADHGKGFSVTPMPVYQTGLVIFSTGYVTPEFVAVDPTGSGDVTESHIVWRTRNAPTMPSFIGHDGQLFSIADNGIMTCVDTKTGKVINRRRVGGNFSASTLLAGGNLYLSSREGLMTIIECSSEMKTIATVKLDSSIMASPILIGNDLLVRTENKLVRIKNAK